MATKKKTRPDRDVVLTSYCVETYLSGWASVLVTNDSGNTVHVELTPYDVERMTNALMDLFKRQMAPLMSQLAPKKKAKKPNAIRAAAKPD